MPLNAAGAFLIVSGIIFLASLGLFIFLWWDKGRYMIEGRDLETGDVHFKKASAKPEGIPWKKKGYEPAYVHPQGHMGTYNGLFFRRPMVTINARTGNVIATEETEYNEDKDAHEGRMVEKTWPQLWYQFVESDAVKQALETQKSFWATHVGAMVITIMVLSIGLVGVVLMFAQGGAA